MQIGPTISNGDQIPGDCSFSEPWTSDSSVFNNIDEMQSDFVDLRHVAATGHGSWSGYVGGINGILFKTTDGSPLGLDSYCDPSALSAETTSSF